MPPAPISTITHLDAVVHGESSDAEAEALLDAAGEQILIDAEYAEDLFLEIGIRIQAPLDEWTKSVFAELALASQVVAVVHSTVPDADPVALYSAAAQVVDRRCAAT